MEKSSFEKPEIEKVVENKEVSQSKIETYLATIDTLNKLDGKSAKKFASLTFYEMILNELDRDKLGSEINELRTEIDEVKTLVRGSDSSSADEALKLLDEKVRILSKK